MNPACPAQLKERLRWFCQRGQMDIEGLGDVLVDQLVEGGLRPRVCRPLQAQGRDDRQPHLGGRAGRQDRQAHGRREGRQKGHREHRQAAASSRWIACWPAWAFATSATAWRMCWRRISAAWTRWPRRPQEAARPRSTRSARPLPTRSTTFSTTTSGKKTIADLKAVGIDPQMEVVKAGRSRRRCPLAGKTIVVTGTLKNYNRDEIEAADSKARRPRGEQRQQEDRLRRRRRRSGQQAGQGQAARREGDQRGGVSWADRRLKLRMDASRPISQAC